MITPMLYGLNLNNFNNICEKFNDVYVNICCYISDRYDKDEIDEDDFILYNRAADYYLKNGWLH